MRQQLLSLTAGGRWACRLESTVQRNLRWFWFDGLFASASDAIVISYLPLFVLALGATPGQIGLMNALSSLSAALVLMPGATLVDRRGQRKGIVVASGGVGTRLALLFLALIPLAFAGPAAIAVAVALTVARSALGNLALPAWIAMTADIVPLSWRGRYFASRNMAMEVAKMIMVLLVGVLITRAGGGDGLVGYQWALGLAFAVGMLSTYSFASLDEPSLPAPEQADVQTARSSLWRTLRADTRFLTFCGVTALWNFSLNIAGPFFNPYLVQELEASEMVVGVLTVIVSLAALPGQRLFGLLSDRWGPRRVQLLTGLLIPLLPLAWLLVRSPWHVVPINLGAGFLWAGYNLASFNFLLALTPQNRRAHFSALYQIILLVALAGGSALGGVLVDALGYGIIFVLSAIGRFVAALLFHRLIRQDP